MIEKILTQLNIGSEELITQKVLTEQALSEIRNFYQRIDNLLNDPSFAEKREHYAYDHIVTHSRKVAFYSVATAQVAKFTRKDCLELAIASVFHDLDKLYWPYALLDKPKDKLTKHDWTRIIEHAVASAIFVERLAKREIAYGVLDIIKQHHENLNGSGYPNRLSGNNICSGARIIRITDSYDSMTSVRPYKTEVSNHDDALKELKHKVNTVYDPELVSLFEAIPCDKISAIKKN